MVVCSLTSRAQPMVDMRGTTILKMTRFTLFWLLTAVALAMCIDCAGWSMNQAACLGTQTELGEFKVL